MSESPSAIAAASHSAWLPTGCKPALAHVPDVKTMNPPGARGGNGGGGGNGVGTIEAQRHALLTEQRAVLALYRLN